MRPSKINFFKIKPLFKANRKYQENIFPSIKFHKNLQNSARKKWSLIKKRLAAYSTIETNSALTAAYPLERLSRVFASKWKAKQMFKSIYQVKKEAEWIRLMNMKKIGPSILEKKHDVNHFGTRPSNVLRHWESRLDVTLWKSGLLPTLAQARQLINHGTIKINGILAKQNSRILKPGDIIMIETNPKELMFQHKYGIFKIPFHLEVHYGSRTIVFSDFPTIDDIELPCPIDIRKLF